MLEAKKNSMAEINQFDRKLVKEIEKNVRRMFEKWAEIRSRGEAFQKSIVDVITIYTLNNKQINNPKGL